MVHHRGYEIKEVARITRTTRGSSESSRPSCTSRKLGGSWCFKPSPSLTVMMASGKQMPSTPHRSWQRRLWAPNTAFPHPDGTQLASLRPPAWRWISGNGERRPSAPCPVDMARLVAGVSPDSRHLRCSLQRRTDVWNLKEVEPSSPAGLNTREPEPIPPRPLRWGTVYEWRQNRGAPPVLSRSDLGYPNPTRNRDLFRVPWCNGNRNWPIKPHVETMLRRVLSRLTSSPVNNSCNFRNACFSQDEDVACASQTGDRRTRSR